MKCVVAELRAQIRQLTDSVDAQYQQRQELSEVILHDAKSRLAKIQATANISIVCCHSCH